MCSLCVLYLHYKQVTYCSSLTFFSCLVIPGYWYLLVVIMCLFPLYQKEHFPPFFCHYFNPWSSFVPIDHKPNHEEYVNVILCDAHILIGGSWDIAQYHLSW